MALFCRSDRRQGVLGQPHRSPRMIGVLFSQLIEMSATVLACYREVFPIVRDALSNAHGYTYGHKAASTSSSSRRFRLAVNR
jgi:hypothetical protein